MPEPAFPVLEPGLVQALRRLRAGNPIGRTGPFTLTPLPSWRGSSRVCRVADGGSGETVYVKYFERPDHYRQHVVCLAHLAARLGDTACLAVPAVTGVSDEDRLIATRALTGLTVHEWLVRERRSPTC